MAGPSAGAAEPPVEADVVVYGATASGLAAAIQASAMGLRAIVVEASDHVGGMTTGGLSSSDVGKAWSIGGIPSEFYRRVGKAYGSDDRVFHFEPKVAAAVFDAWLREAGVTVVTNEPLDLTNGVVMRDGRIESFTSESGRTFRGTVFVDASFEGDLMASAGVSCTVGREPEARYGESLAGIRRGDRTPRPHYTQGDKDHFITAVDPFIRPGDATSGLLPGVKAVDFDTFVDGAGDDGVQAYTYRLCVTDAPANRIPFEQPEGYREINHELLLRVFESGDTRLPILSHKLPNHKFDWNSMHAVGIDLPGASWPYPEADHATRKRIAAEHARYVRGVLWTLAFHPRVPESIRAVVARHGWCRDEFTATGGFPPQLYVREGRRMISDVVVTQGVCLGAEPCEDPVALGSFGLDSHAVQYFVNEQRHVRREGVFWRVPPKPYGISWRAIRPRRAECENLLVPTCVSASHAAYGSLRMEPVYMALGQAAGTAAALAIRAGTAVQDVPYAQLRTRLIADGAILSGERAAKVASTTVTPWASSSSDGLAAALAMEHREGLVADVERIGDPARGSTIFHTRHLTCVQCHSAGSGSSPLGPNLAAMPPNVPRDALVAHLVESLLDPSAVVRPEYRGVTILTTKGTTHTGLIARESASEVVLRDAATGGGEIVIPVESVDERTVASRSLMPAGLPNLLADRRQFLDLVRYLAEVATGGPSRADALSPDPAAIAPHPPAAYESDVDHAGFLTDWQDPRKARASLRRGEALYARVCANCHGTLEAPGSLPTAPRFAEGPFKHGSDPHAMYQTLTRGNGQMVAQTWMVPSQKYDVIHYIRETFLKDHHRDWYTPITRDYLSSLPPGTSRGPEASTIEPWRLHDYGPFLAGTFEVGRGGGNVARKGLAVRLDPGPGGIGRGHAWILYELDTLRAAAVWTGDAFIDWGGITFDGRHGRHPRVHGAVMAALPTMPGWADPATGGFTDPRPLGRDEKPYGPLPRSHGRFQALHHAAMPDDSAAEPLSVVVLDQLIGTTRVLETASLAAPIDIDSHPQPVVVRSFSCGPRPRPLVARLAAAPAAAAIVASAKAAANGPHIVAADGFVDLHIPAGETPLDLAVAVAACDSAALTRHAASLAPPPPPRSLIGRSAPRLWPATLETPLMRGDDTAPFAVDELSAPDTNPWNAQLRFSGIDFTGLDEAVLCTWDGDVWQVRGIEASSGTLRWRRIASGLFQPLGIKRIDGQTFVACRDRILTLVDLDGDGLTDRYDTFNDDHQVTEHFHEFAMGLETDAAGNLYYAKAARHALPAVVPHHGTLLRVSRDGASTEIVANGFRAPNGVCVEPDGTFWITDQEGHWHPKNRINVVRAGGFYGNMFGYHDVVDASDTAMEPPAFWITNAFDRSPAEMLRVTSTRWQPITGGLLELSYGEGRVHLVLTEPAAVHDGVVQGGMVALPMPDLPTGIMRGRFHPTDGHLYACGLFAWAGNQTRPGGFFRIRRTARPLLIPTALHTAPNTIELTFPEPLDPVATMQPEAWRVRTWNLVRSERYGSDHHDETNRSVAEVTLSADGRRVTLHVPGFSTTWSYALEWNVTAATGSAVRGVLHGTMH